ncbi:MAG TPA: translation initiation factor IF-3 [Anaerolineaceae bacterium]|nr:translation initiation factor IF-3 [Anaerolineaceae bacterium]
MCSNFERSKTISTSNYRVNEEIKAKEVRLIVAEGENIGLIPTQKAMEMAREADLDLVEVAPGANPPVCRIMNYGKFLYERTKKEREARKAQTKIETKEIRLRPKTNEHHRGFKTRDARRWLEEGMKVKVTVRFRGREITYPEIALEDLKEIAEELSDIAIVEQKPDLEGRNMFMLLSPSKGVGKKAKAPNPKNSKVQAKGNRTENQEEVEE